MCVGGGLEEDVGGEGLSVCEGRGWGTAEEGGDDGPVRQASSEVFAYTVKLAMPAPEAAPPPHVVPSPPLPPPLIFVSKVELNAL